MKSELGKLFLCMALLLLPLGAFCQKKVYTRSFRIQDFKTRTTKVVLDGPPSLVSALREDVTSLWSVSPYEFCTAAEYEQQKQDPSLYFLRPVVQKGLILLTLSKGGNDKDQNSLNNPMTIVSLPVCGENYEDPLLYMPAFISIIQDYAEAATDSERVAYMGLGSICRPRPRGVKVCKDPEESRRLFISGDPSAAIRVVITPDGNTAAKPRCTVVFGAETYELYSYAKAG